MSASGIERPFQKYAGRDADVPACLTVLGKSRSRLGNHLQTRTFDRAATVRERSARLNKCNPQNG